LDRVEDAVREQLARAFTVLRIRDQTNLIEHEISFVVGAIVERFLTLRLSVIEVAMDDEVGVSLVLERARLRCSCESGPYSGPSRIDDLLVVGRVVESRFRSGRVGREVGDSSRAGDGGCAIAEQQLMDVTIALVGSVSARLFEKFS
jgi:hypothetical protein